MPFASGALQETYVCRICVGAAQERIRQGPEARAARALLAGTRPRDLIRGGTHQSSIGPDPETASSKASTVESWLPCVHAFCARVAPRRPRRLSYSWSAARPYLGGKRMPARSANVIAAPASLAARAGSE